MSNMSNLNELIRMEHEVGTTNKPPKMMKIANYLTWKDRFQSFAEYQDARMWMCIEDGYSRPTHDFEGRQRVTDYENMNDAEKRMYEAEKKALAAIKMSLPDDIKHTFKRYMTSKDMWDALEKRYDGNADVKKNKVDLLKKQFAVFKGMRNESLEDIVTRYYHLMSEMDNYNIEGYTDVEMNDKLLDALPAKWDIYTLMIKKEANYEKMDLEKVVGQLRAYELHMKKKDTGYDQVQDPEIYKGLSSTYSQNASSDSATAFLSCENEQIVTNSDGDLCFVAASGSSSASKRQQSNNQNNNTKSMPLSVKAAEEHLALLASFVASYENYIQGRISDPATFDEDYDQIDPDDLEEMDLQWQMAMISRRVKRFMNRTGRKFVGKSVGFDKSKVRCYNCQNFGHFARDCQRPKTESRPSSSFQEFPGHGSSNNRNASNNNSSKALISTSREGSYDWSVHLEGDNNSTQAFIAEIVQAHAADQTEKVTDYEAAEAEKIDADQTGAEQGTDQNGAELGADQTEAENAADKKKAADFAAFMADLSKSTGEVKSNSVSSVCLKCCELQGEVDKLTKQNQSLVTESSNLKESNFFAKRNESLYLKKIKGYENEIKILTCKLNDKLQVIDLAHDAMSEKTKEISEKCKELTDAQLKIVELEKKLDQFRDSTFVMKHMMSGTKKSNDKEGVGFKGFNEVPPPLGHDYSFLPNEDELTNFGSTTPSSSKSSNSDVVENDDAKKENNREPVLKKNNSPSKNNNQTFVKKVTFVKGGEMKNETTVIENESNVEFAKNKNKDKSEIQQTKQDPSIASSSSSSSVKASVTKSSTRRWCFKCHTKGHLASCCPNKQSEAHVSVPKQQKGVAVGVDKAEKQIRFQRNQQRFQPESTSGRYERPRSWSPRMNNHYGQSNNFRSQSQYQNRYQNNGGRNFYNNGFRNYNFKNSWNQLRSFNQNFQGSQGPNMYRKSQDQRPSGNRTPFPSTGPRSKTPIRSDGFWMDVKIVGEFGRPKTIKAWVPQSN